MEYRNYRSDGPRIPPKFRRYLHMLCPLRSILTVSAIAIPFLAILKIPKITILGNHLAFFLILLGLIFYLMGLPYVTYIDRTSEDCRVSHQMEILMGFSALARLL